METSKNETKINNKIVDMGSIEIDGIDTSDYPDFCDAYISSAKFEDGTDLDEDELETLQENIEDEMHEMIINQLN